MVPGQSGSGSNDNEGMTSFQRDPELTSGGSLLIYDREIRLYDNSKREKNMSWQKKSSYIVWQVKKKTKKNYKKVDDVAKKM